MAEISIEKAILDEIHRLEIDQQRKVLVFARSLSLTPPEGIPGKDLLRFAGTIEKDDLTKMAQAINEPCESINCDEW